MSSNYIEPDKFLKEIQKYYKTKIISKELANMFTLLAKKILNSYSFNRYNIHEKDEMISDAVLTCIKVIESFNIKEYDNPFTYFTRVVKNSFKQSRKLYYKKQNERLDIIEEVYRMHNKSFTNEIKKSLEERKDMENKRNNGLLDVKRIKKEKD